MTVLFLCRQNAGRSQMAQAFFEQLAPHHASSSGGSSPAAAVHPIVIEAMREVGIDLSGRRPRRVDAAMLERADLVVSMGCDDPAVCDYPGRPVEDWGIEDPSGRPIVEVRRIRDTLRARVEELARRLDRTEAAANTAGPRRDAGNR
jgi:arsenate reductase